MKKRNVLLVLLASLLVGCNDTTVSTNSSSNTSVNSSSTSSSSSSSSSEVQKYTVSVSDTSVSVDKQSAAEGDTVTVTVNPAEGKGLVRLTSNVDSVTFTEVTSGTTYTFVMPASNITITAEYGNLHSVTKFNSYVEPGVSYTDLTTKYPAGKEVTLTFTVDSNRATDHKNNIDSYLVHINDLVVRPTFVDAMQVTFTMPDADLDISLAQQSADLTEATEGGVQIVGEGDAQYVKFLGFDPSKKYTYQSNQGVFITFVLASNYRYDSVKYKVDDGNEQEAYPMGTGQEGVYRVNLEAATSKFTLKVEGHTVTTRNITYVNADGITSNSGNQLPTTFVPGDQLQLYKFELSDQTKYIKGISVTKSDGTSLPEGSINAGPTYIQSSSMPDEDIKITFELGNKHKIIVEQNDHISNVSISIGDAYGTQTEYAAPGDYVNINFTCDTGYKVTKARLSNEEEDRDVSGSSLSFKFPEKVEGDLTVTFTTVQVHSVDLDETALGEDAEVRFSVYNGSYDYGQSYVEGEKISGSLSFGNPLYTLTGLKAKNHDDLSITLEGSSFSFTMPAYDVTLVPTVTKAEPQHVSLTKPTSDSILTVEINGQKTGYDSRILYSKNPQEGQANVLELDFVPSDTLTIRVEVNNQESKIPVIKFDGETSSKQNMPNNKYGASEDSSNYSFDNITLPSDATGITVDLVEKPTYKIDVTNESSVELVYKVNGQDATSLDSVGLFDEIEIAIKDGVSGVYNIVIKNKDGDRPLTQGSNRVTYRVSEEFKVEVTKDTTKHMLHIDNQTSEKISFNSYYYSGIIEDNKTIPSYQMWVQNSTEETLTVKVVLKIGTEAKITKTKELEKLASFYFIEDGDNITVTDDVYIEVTLATE